MKYLLSLPLLCLGLLIVALHGEAQAEFDNGHTILVATAADNVLPVEVRSNCKEGDAVFIVKNLGAKFASAIDFSIVEISDGKVFSKRRMNLRAGQSATFKLRDANKISGEIGLSMDAKWLPRDNHIYASVRCNA